VNHVRVAQPGGRRRLVGLRCQLSYVCVGQCNVGPSHQPDPHTNKADLVRSPLAGPRGPMDSHSPVPGATKSSLRDVGPTGQHDLHLRAHGGLRLTRARCLAQRVTLPPNHLFLPRVDKGIKAEPSLSLSFTA
jgi:hypothetical protein